MPDKTPYVKPPDPPCKHIGRPFGAPCVPTAGHTWAGLMRCIYCTGITSHKVPSAR